MLSASQPINFPSFGSLFFPRFIFAVSPSHFIFYFRTEVKKLRSKIQIDQPIINSNDRQIDKARDRLGEVGGAAEPGTRPALIIDHEHEADGQPAQVDVLQLLHKQTRLLRETPTRVTQQLQCQNQQVRQQSKRAREEDQADPKNHQGSQEPKQYSQLRQGARSTRIIKDYQIVDTQVPEAESRDDQVPGKNQREVGQDMKLGLVRLMRRNCNQSDMFIEMFLNQIGLVFQYFCLGFKKIYFSDSTVDHRFHPIYKYLNNNKTQIMTQPTYLPILLLTLLLTSNSLPVSLQLHPFQNITQPPTTINITIKPNESYVYSTSYLQPQYQYVKHCRGYPGQLSEIKLSTFPVDTQKQVYSPSPIFENVNYVYSAKYGIIYRLDHGQILAYQFSEKQGKLKYLDKVSFKNNDQRCGAQIALTADEEYLFYFSCLKIVRIQMKRSLAVIHVVEELSQAFYGFKLLAGNGFFIWASYSEGARIYTLNQNNTLSLNQTLKNFQTETTTIQKITDIQLNQLNRLYLLGHQKTLFIFQQLGTGQFHSKLNLTLTPLCLSCTHRQLLIHQSNIYIQSMQNSQQFVIQLQEHLVDSEIKNVNLVRYFKGDRNYVGMSIWNGNLMIAYKHKLNLYEINRDPRTIARKMNGISTSHFQEIQNIIRIAQNIFIKTTTTTAQLTKFTLTKPHIQCQFPQPQPQTLTIHLKQLCYKIQHRAPHKYYQSCLTQTVINIEVKEQPGEFHIFAVIAVLVFCAAVVGVLIIWRKSKIDLIQGIVGEINRIKQRKAEEKIEFVQHKQPIREVNWNEIEQSYENQQKAESNTIKRQKSQEKQRQVQLQQVKKSSNYSQQLHEQIEDDFVQGTERDMVQNKK